MAITQDAVASSTPVSATSATLSFTVANQNDRILLVGVTGKYGGSDVVTGITYNGVAMTRLSTPTLGDRWLSWWYLLAPATGTHNIVVSNSESNYIAFEAGCWYGVKQQAPHEGTTVSGTATSFAPTVTTSDDNAFVLSYAGTANRSCLTNNADTTELTTGSNKLFAYASNPKTPAGAVTLHMKPSDSSSQKYVGFIADISPVTASSAIKSINGLAKASVKSVNGLAIASVKSWNGLA